MKQTKFRNDVSLGCFLILVMLLLVIVGAGGYQKVLQLSEETKEERTIHSFLRSQVLSHDSLLETAGEWISAVEVRDNGEMLVLKETDGQRVFETRLYVYNGSLVEEYTFEGAEIDPKNAQKIQEETDFFCQWLPNGFLQVETSEGSVQIMLHAAIQNAERMLQ